MKQARTGLNILVVEDESLILMLLQGMLLEIGHTCAFTASRVETARELAEHAAYDLAILDVNLKGEATYAIAEIAAARGLPFIFATGYGVQGIDEAFQDIPILQKPFDASALRGAIETAMDKAALE